MNRYRVTFTQVHTYETDAHCEEEAEKKAYKEFEKDMYYPVANTNYDDCEVETLMQEENRWYAVQETSEDAWDNGSDNYETAVSMLEAQGHGLIAVINESSGVCEEEIEYEDLF